jgi:uncharacterized membrane protein
VSPESPSPPTPRTRELVVLLTAVVVVWALVGFLVPRIAFTGWPERGLFGDTFGAVNALFSALAFAGVLYAIRLQSAELSLQRQELRETREELARTAKAQEVSAANLAKQAAALEATARLSALNAVIDHYRVAYEKAAGITAKEAATRQRDRYIAALEAELAKLTPLGL